MINTIKSLNLRSLSRLGQTLSAKDQDATFEQVLPQVQRELIVKYDNDLTKVSNYSYVHKRDDAGNIILKENATDNQFLTIEPVTYEFDTEFINKTINTRFSYFRFPATSIAASEVPSFNSTEENIYGVARELRSLETTPGYFSVDQIIGADTISNLDASLSGVTNTNTLADTATTIINSAPFNDTYQTSGNLYEAAKIGQG
jgi:hypothetical protein